MKLDIRRILRIMDRDNAIRIARQYKDAISGHFNPTKVYLYGSYSKGTQREDSDIDIAVVVPKWLLAPLMALILQLCPRAWAQI